MKEIILLLCGILIGRQLMAQTFAEWFRQNHTQLKYLAEQMAALRAYDGVLEEGYGIAQDGLVEIAGIRREDLDLHSDHFAELRAPSAAVSLDATVGSIQQYCALLAVVADEIEQAGLRLPSELNWPVMGPTLAAGLRETVEGCREWLQELLAGDRYVMDDAGRLRAFYGMNLELKSLYGKALYLLAQLNNTAINPLL